MDSRQIEAAYLPFAASFRAGGFVSPEQGWDASMIAAHLITNNDLISSVAEQVASGGRPSYDNADVIDEEQLREFVAAAGSVEDIAQLLMASAARLAAAWEYLGTERGGIEVPAKIADGGVVFREGPVPVRAFIEGNATFHLELHLGQLNALRP
jgi:hypothetical protein